ncbi:hypothetical protein llap_12518 [Limosa lapponica baueri]|uniref:Rna-directed dna polymerase from mobile element jockey-like n=1 Tax=Limosa lapponica baueri TaxID=1758121 RepID=A0A2I0TTQ0_LIMLA|nr:hypothetical protein llap_12518 [Limosa lapponica baueri]
MVPVLLMDRGPGESMEAQSMSTVHSSSGELGWGGYTLSKFAVNTNLGRVADAPEECAAIQRDHKRLKKWAGRSLMRSKKGKCKVLHLGWNSPRHQYRLEAAQLESSSAEKDSGVPVDNKLFTSQQCAVMARTATTLLGCTRLSVASRTRKGILPLCSALQRHNWVQCWGSQYRRDMGLLE